VANCRFWVYVPKPLDQIAGAFQTQRDSFCSSAVIEHRLAQKQMRRFFQQGTPPATTLSAEPSPAAGIAGCALLIVPLSAFKGEKISHQDQQSKTDFQYQNRNHY
jgi:hypothetical protein